MDDYLIFLIPLAIATAGLGLGWWITRAAGWFVMILWALTAVVAGVLFWLLENAQGWDGLGYLFVLMGGVGPFGFGTVFGTIVGAIGRRNAAS
jgi:hypothetical protein